jgi:hypothetical protein
VRNLNIKSAEDLQREYPELVKKIQSTFPNSPQMIDKMIILINSIPGSNKLITGLITGSLAPNVTNKMEQSNPVNIKTVNDLKAAYPELVNEIVSNALAQERIYNLDKSNEIRQSIAAEQKVIENIAAAANRKR